MAPLVSNKTLIAQLLEEQSRLAAVERFASRSAQEQPPEERSYRSLIPLTAPRPGEQYAFQVDLDKCSGCKACVAACHALNGLDEDESWRSVGLLVGGDRLAPVQQTVTTACHHCADPACLNGCPVLAYEKEPATGIVRHLDEQCIGCQYCLMMCPYEVPRYRPERGIVRKCDMCHGRLSRGEAPACVQACPNEAIQITLVRKDELERAYRPHAAGRVSSATNPFLPSTPDPSLTLPTTRYLRRSRSRQPLRAADSGKVEPGAPHWPLTGLLVLTQAGVGCLFSSYLTDLTGGARSPVRLLESALVLFLLGLAAGAAHLGRPLKAWRSFLGWRTSWFSREAILFSGFLPLLALALLNRRLEIDPWGFAGRLGEWPRLAAAVVGALAVVCSAMIYVATGREFWSGSRTFVRFFGTTVILGLAAAFFWVPTSVMAGALAATVFIKLAFEREIFRHLEETPEPGPLNNSARLLSEELGLRRRIGIACSLAGAAAALLLTAAAPPFSEQTLPSMAFGLPWLLCGTGESVERHLFFTAVAPARMPGGAG